MKIKNLFVLAMLFLASGNIVDAETRWTPEHVAIHTVELAMRGFALEHDNKSPTSWAQLGTNINLDKLNQRTGASISPLQEHFVFLTNEIPMFDYQAGNVVLIGTDAIEESGRNLKGRYVIARNNEGFYYRWLPEEKVQQMLAKAGVTELPKPEPWIPRTNNAPQSPVAQTSNLLEGANSPTIIQSSESVSNGTPEANLQTKPEPTQIAQTTSSKTWKIIALAAFIFLLLGWMIYRKGKLS